MGRHKRLGEWLTTYLGAENTPLNRAVGRLTLTAAVSRVWQPGCKFDTMMVLEGEQGAGKSRTVQALCPDPAMFTDSVTLRMDTKEIMELTADKWIVELGELAGLNKAETEHVKALLSRQWDEARMAYGRYKTKKPRQFIFIGTTNEATYLTDDTGNRRYFPVKVGKVDVEALKRDRNQLWAEAAFCEAKGEPIFISDPELIKAHKVLQRTREIHDEWEGMLAEWLKKDFPVSQDKLDRTIKGKRLEMTVSAAADALIGKGQRVNLDSQTQKRIARCLRKCGWERSRKSDGKYLWARVDFRDLPQGPSRDQEGPSGGSDEEE